ncbi:MAG: GGDEF domain-containing protein [Desulfonatronovibrionaceae bacterium]
MTTKTARHPLAMIRPEKEGAHRGVLYFELDHFNLFQNFFDGNLALQVMEVAEETITDCAAAFKLFDFTLKKMSPGAFLLKYSQDIADTQMTELAVRMRPVLNSSFNKKLVPLTGQKMKFVIGHARLDLSHGASSKDTEYIAAAEAQKHARTRNSLRQLAVLKEFREILANKDLRIVYQPIMDLKKGRIYGWEALTRGPENSQFSSPLALFDFAEEEGKLFELETITRELAIKNCGQLREGSKLFLNIHPNTLADPSFQSGRTLQLLKEQGMHPSDIVFEVTEKHSLKDLSVFHRTLNHYRNQGYQIAVDDVGAGYSGLYRIAEIRPDILKIDRDLIRDINTHPAKRALMEAFISFANHIEATVIAEGIETDMQLRALMEMGFHCGQGYYLGHPVAPKEHPQLRPTRGDTSQISFAQYGVSLTIENLAEKTMVISEETKINEVKKAFESNQPLGGIVVCRGDAPVGLVMSHHLDRELSTYFGPALYYDKDIVHLMDKSPLVVDRTTPVEEVARQAMQRVKHKIYDHVIVTKGGKLVGIAAVQDILDAMARVQVELAKGSNPLSGLPGNLNIEMKVEKRVQKYQRPTSVIYLDLDNFKAYNDVYGFQNGDQIILLTSRILTWAMQRHGDQNSFVGHIGGDDFILITHPDRAERVCLGISRCFGRLIKKFYHEEDLCKGFIVTKGREKTERKYPLVSVSMAIVDCLDPLSLSEISELATGTKKRAKSIPGNSYVRNRRSPVSK